MYNFSSGNKPHKMLKVFQCYSKETYWSLASPTSLKTYPQTYSLNKYWTNTKGTKDFSQPLSDQNFFSTSFDKHVVKKSLLTTFFPNHMVTETIFFTSIYNHLGFKTFLAPIFLSILPLNPFSSIFFLTLWSVKSYLSSPSPAICSLKFFQHLLPYPHGH